MPVFTIELPNGKRIDAEADTEEAALSGAQSWYKQLPQQQAQQPEKTDESFTSAFSQGAANLVHGVGSTIKNYISKDAGAAVEKVGAAQANPRYKSATEEFTRPSDGADKHFLGVGWSSAPRALIEQAPALATDLLTQMALRKAGPLVKLAGGALTYGARTAGDEAQKRADARTGETGSEPSTEDKVIGLGSTAAQGALNAYGAGKIVNPAKVTGTGLKGVAQTAGNVGKAVAAEGTTNAAQETISDVAATAGTDKGVSVDPEAIKAAGILGGIGGGVFGGARGVKDVAQARSTRGSDFGEHSTLAANRLIEKSGSQKRLENAHEAFSAVKGAQADIGNELATAAKTVSEPSIETANALSRAQKGDFLTKRELDVIDAEGNSDLSSLVRQQNALSKLTKNGSFNTSTERFAGGLGEVVRNHAGKLAIGAGGASALPHIFANGAAGLDSLAAAIPGVGLALGAGAAAYPVLKGFERFAGVSSPARAFAEKFGDSTGQVRPSAPPPATLPEPSEVKLLQAQHGLESGLEKIVGKVQSQKRRDTAQELAPLLRQLAARNKLMPERPEPVREQVPPTAPVLAEPKSVDTRRAPQEDFAPQGSRFLLHDIDGNPIAPIAPQGPKAVDTRGATPQSPREGESIVQQALAAMQAQRSREQPQSQQDFVLPESPHVFKDTKTAAQDILAAAVAGGKEIRHAAGFKAGVKNRLDSEEAIYTKISDALSSVEEQGAFHKYLSALWGSDGPEVAKQVRAHMIAEFPQHTETINKHLSDEAIKDLWKPKKKKA